MDKTEVITTATTAIVAGQKSAVGGSMMLSSMVIFNDPSYWIIGVIGAFVSVGSEYYDMHKLRRELESKGEIFNVSIPFNLFKAFVIGLLITLLSFLFMSQAGEALIKHIFGIGVAVKMLPSFWMLGTILLSTKSVAMYNKFSLKMGWV